MTNTKQAVITNIMMIFGVLLLLASISFMIFAYVYYGMYPFFRENFHRTTCNITDALIQPGYDGMTERAIWRVSYVNKKGLYEDDGAALIDYDGSWTSHEQVVEQLQRFPVGRLVPSCYVPNDLVNLFEEPKLWLIDRFAMLDFEPAELSELKQKFRSLFWTGVAFIIISPILITIPICIYVGTDCFQMRFRWKYFSSYLNKIYNRSDYQRVNDGPQDS